MADVEAVPLDEDDPDSRLLSNEDVRELPTLLIADTDFSFTDYVIGCPRILLSLCPFFSSNSCDHHGSHLRADGLP